MDSSVVVNADFTPPLHGLDYDPRKTWTDSTWYSPRRHRAFFNLER